MGGECLVGMTMVERLVGMFSYFVMIRSMRRGMEVMIS